MTKLRKVVKRETPSVFIRRALIIQLEPPNVIGIREKGRRKAYFTTVERVYKLAILDEMEARKKAKHASKHD